MGERAVRTALEGRIRGGLVRAAGREEHRLRAPLPRFVSSTRALRSTVRAGLAADGAGPVSPVESAAAGSGAASQGHGLLDVLEVLEAGPAVAGVQEDLEEHSLGDALEQVMQLVVEMTVLRSHWSPPA